MLSAICDLDQALAAKAAKQFGIGAVYGDIDTMLRAERPDGVVVITPLAVTHRVAGQVLRQGYATLLEKPPGKSVRDCRAIIAAAKVGRARNMVAFNRRFCPVLVQGKAETLKRGPVKGAAGRMYRHKRTDDDFFYGTGIHSLDALRSLAGDIRTVETDRRALAKGECPAFTLLIGFASGASGTLAIRPQAGVQLERYEVFAPQTVTLINAGVGWLIDRPGSCELYEANARVKLPDALAPYRKFKGALAEAAAGGFYGENAHFVEALRGRAAFTPTVEESLQSVQIAEAVQSGRNWRA